MRQSMLRWSVDVDLYMRLAILFDMFLNPSFIMTTNFTNVAGLQLAQVNLYARKNFKSSRIGSL